MGWWDDIKRPFYAVAAQDSRNIEKLAQAWNLPDLEREAHRNVDNPGHAIGKAAEWALRIYLGQYGGAGGGEAVAEGAAGAGAGAAGNAALYSGGMFGDAALAGMSQMTQQQLAQVAMQQMAQQAAQQAAAQAAQNTLTGSAGGMFGSGMFAQVPGAGAEQTAMLNAQTDIFGGRGADMTARAAMPAVKDAYSAGRMGTMDYLGNVAKADAAGMNDLGVWGDRFSRNARRLAGSKQGQEMAMKALMGGQQPQPQPSGWRAPPGKLPEQIRAPRSSTSTSSTGVYSPRTGVYSPSLPGAGDSAGTDSAYVKQLIARAQAGDRAALRELEEIERGAGRGW